jgi:hypothetical protein
MSSVQSTAFSLHGEHGERAVSAVVVGVLDDVAERALFIDSRRRAARLAKR